MTLLDRMALMNTQQNIKPPSESLEDFFKRSVATLANPALSMARGEQATPQDVIQAITGQQTRSWTDVTSETFPGNVAAALQDAEQKGLMIKAITKRPDFVKTWGDHPNLRINISTDLLPREMSNAPTIDEAVNLAGGRENIKVRAVALNRSQAEKLNKDKRIDVVTLYHGPTNFNADGVRTDKLFKIVKAQNPELVKRVGEKKLKAELDTWENMPPMSKYGKDLQQRSSKVCCGGGKCSRDKTKCGFGVGSIIAGVYVPIWFDGVSDEQ